ncbi:hypothetical protein LSAT2_025398 [Lamellibrachia satsuma]|nr:hypothetical protein LSAT2_025398 [Lamellibrachia satsuma]
MYTVWTLFTLFSFQLCRGEVGHLNVSTTRSRNAGILREKPDKGLDNLLIRRILKAQRARRDTTTGPRCVSSCVGFYDGYYQSCLGCDIYVTCINGLLIDHQQCSPNRVYDDELRSCQFTSNTCKLVIIDSASTPVNTTKGTISTATKMAAGAAALGVVGATGTAVAVYATSSVSAGATTGASTLTNVVPEVVAEFFSAFLTKRKSDDEEEGEDTELIEGEK